MAVTVRQKQRGRGNPWWVFVHLNGTIRSKRVGDKRAAESLASEIRRKLKAGELSITTSRPKCPTFGDYAQRYLDEYARTACKWTTWQSYEVIIRRHLLPVWKGMRINTINRADVKELILDKQRQGFARGTVENIKALISGILSHALEDGLIANNPALRLGRFIQRQDLRRHVHAFTQGNTVCSRP